MAEQPRFYYDLATPECWLAAERVLTVFDVVPEWVPILPVGEPAWRCEHEELSWREDVARRAVALELLPVRWPPVVPAEVGWATLAATYAKTIGRGVAFSLAAMRQAFAAGRDLGERDNVLIAAAACEMHPAAVIKGAELRGTATRLSDACARAEAEGVRALPAVVVDGRVVEGERAIPVLAP